MSTNLNRRQFLKSTSIASGMLLTINLPGIAKGNDSRIEKDAWSVYLSIREDNTITIASPVADMGQHMRTTGPMLLAEELDIDWDDIKLAEDCPTYLNRSDKGHIVYKYANMNSGGSHAARQNWDYLRMAGATARRMLLEEAGEYWAIDANLLTTQSAHIIHPKTKQKLSYGSLASAAAKRLVDIKSIKLKPEAEFRIIGHDIHTIDLHKMVTGKPLYGLDMDYENALQAVIHRAPFHGASVKSFNEKAAMSVPGVKKVILIKPQMDEYFPGSEKQIVAAGVAVIATSLWAAMKAKKLLETQWQEDPEWANESSEEQLQAFRKLVTSETITKARLNDGDIDKAFDQAELVLDEVYELPLWAHACMEPFNCIADIREQDATIIVGHQFPQAVATTVEKITGIDALNIEVINKRMGGGFGRRWESDFVREAATISAAIKQPVKLTWMREDEVEQDFFGPAAVMRVRAGLDDTNTVLAWHHRHASTREGPRDTCFPYKLIKNFRSEALPTKSKIPTGPWRGPGHSQWSFASESMIDELAAAANIDPLTFRLNLMKPHAEFEHSGYGASVIDSGRMAACYRSAAGMASWGRDLPKGHGLGIAGHFTFGSYAAFVIEVSVDTNDKLSIHEAWGAIDCGIAINPNHIRNQMQGGFLDGINAALLNKVNIERGRVQNNNFHSLPWLKMAQSPNMINVDIIKNDHLPTGVGEPPTAPAAAALTNAIFAASGKRIRTLPISQTLKV